MNLYIPELGDKIELTSDWSFNLIAEYRNKSLMKKIGFDVEIPWRYNRNPGISREVVIPKGTILKISRIYIRQGNSEFSSVTFIVESGEFKKCRFWAKLSDVNNIEYSEYRTGNNICMKITIVKMKATLPATKEENKKTLWAIVDEHDHTVFQVYSVDYPIDIEKFYR